MIPTMREHLPKSTELAGVCPRKLTRRVAWRVMLPPAVDEHLRAGRVILGRFRLERYLGRGGMGTVWEARHLSLETQIAIKFLNEDLSRRQDVLARFAREATSAARIRSPHVVSILDSGFTEDGQGFIAMELLHGEDLSRRLSRDGKLTLGETALLVTQVSRGLAKAHAVGVVHRDLKPENIFVINEDEVFAIKILDFGIAKSVDSASATHKTDTGQLLGTPLYMSPEQALGRPLDSRSDLYSLAVLAYRCLTGRPPFTYPAVGELIVAVSTHPPPPPSQFNSALPASIDDWFAGALAKDPSQRICQNAAEVADSFRQACGSALENHHPSSGRLRISTPRTGAPTTPARSDTEEAPIPSAEEVATTISARHTAVGARPLTSAKRSNKWRLRAVLAAVAASATVAALGFRDRNKPRQPGPALTQSVQASLVAPVVEATSLGSPSALPPTAEPSSEMQDETQAPSLPAAGPNVATERSSPHGPSAKNRPVEKTPPTAQSSTVGAGTASTSRVSAGGAPSGRRGRSGERGCSFRAAREAEPLAGHRSGVSMAAKVAWAVVVVGLACSAAAKADPLVNASATDAAPATSSAEVPSTPPAESDPEAARRAEAELVRLRALNYYDAGDYSAARREFERANQLLYNLGVVSLALRDPASAYDYFQRCLAQGRQELPEDRRSELEKQLQDLSKETVLLTVTVNLPGALILIDDQRVAEAPLAAPLRRNPGTARVVARLADGRTLTRNVELVSGQAAQVNLEFAIAPPLLYPAPATRPERHVPWVGWAATAVLATGAVVAGVQAISAQNSYQTAIGSIGTSRAELDQLDAKTTRWSVTADVLTGAAVVAGAFSLYLTLRHPPSASANSGLKNFSLQLQTQRVGLGMRF
jgi:eukaryotic-like serine/threonine-protein kinase